jgi:hypothetical protein
MMALRVIQGDNHVPRVLFSLPTSPISDYFLSKAHLTVLDNGSMLVSIAHDGPKRRFHVYHAANGSEAASRIHRSRERLI